MKILILLNFFLIGNIFSNPLKSKFCYFKVDFELKANNIYTKKIICKTLETSFTHEILTELKVGDSHTDTTIVMVKYFKIGKKKKLKNYNSVHINLQLVDKSGIIIEEIKGEILNSDWICNVKEIVQ